MFSGFNSLENLNVVPSDDGHETGDIFGLIEVDRLVWVCNRGLGSTGRIMNLQGPSIQGTKKGRRMLTYANFIWAFVRWLRFSNLAFPSR